jgi:hypothetical protein
MIRSLSASSRSARLRFIGMAMLLLGMAAAALVYWGRSPDLPDDASTVGFYKASSRQMGLMYGQFGVLIDDLCADLKRPGVQAMIILGMAALAMFVCFYLARLFERHEAPAKDAAP